MRTFLLAVVLLAIYGCASSGTRIDIAQLSEIRKGQTTYTDIVRKFGRPNFDSKNLNGTRTTAYADSSGRSDAAVLLPLMGAVVSGADSGVDSVIFYFDVADVLTGYRTTQDKGAKSAQANPGEPARTGSDAPGQTRRDPPAPARPDAARKSSDRFELPSWLPSEIRDHRDR